MSDLIKKKLLKKIITIIMVFVISFVSVTDRNNIYVKAAGHTQDEAVAWATSQIGKGLDYDGVYGNQCVDLIKYYYAYFGAADYAKGNANAYITNNLPSGWIRVYNNYQPGDIAVWKVNHSCGTCSTSKYGHVGIITSADSVGFNAVNQNFNSQNWCTQNWFNIFALDCAIRPTFSNNVQPAPPSAPSVYFSDFNQNGVWDNNAEVYIKLMNPDRRNVTSVGCYLYDSNDTLLKTYSENCSYTTSYVNYNCNFNNDMGYILNPGTTYKFILYGIVDGQEYKDEIRTFTTTSSDKEVPVISDVNIYDINENGYKVKCKVTDNVGVNRVQFPTWTTKDGQDDIINGWDTNIKAGGIIDSDGYYVYNVSISEHGYERGEYNTHIYAYDDAGNQAIEYVPVVMVNNANENSPSSTPSPTPTPSPTLPPTPTPSSDTPIPVPQTPAPMTPAPAPETFTPTPETFIPAPETFTPAPITFTPAPEMFTPAPITFTPAPETFTPAPDMPSKPKRGKIIKVSSIKKKKMNVIWLAGFEADGYQLQYGTNKNFQYAKKKVINSRYTISTTISKLKSKKKYYIRVRAYTEYNGKKIYGRWSTKKSCKVK